MQPSREPPDIYDSIVETIGNTPIVRLNKTFNFTSGQFFGKIETFNPGRSSKDRIGITIVEDAEEKGLLKPGGTIVEATSGNTGLGLALVAIERGYDVVLVMPDKMSPEKINLVKAIGCEVIVCPTDVEPDDPKSYYSVSKRIAEERENSFYANQYFNPSNPEAHYNTTGPEIWKQTKGKITHFFAGVGTGGTISGVGKYLKEKNPYIKIVGIDPEGSILAHYHKYRNTKVEAHSYKVEGVGEDIIPSTVFFDVIDDFVKVNDEESFIWTRRLAREEGLLLGGSSGLAAAGVAKYAKEHDDETIYGVILFPDTGERYLGKIFSDAWLRSNGFLPAPTNIPDLLSSKPANIPSIISVSPSNSLVEALEKLKKFGINQLIVRYDNKNPKVLTREILYDALLTGKSKLTSIDSLMLDDLHMLDLHSSLVELIHVIIQHNVILITDKDEWIGILTKQDIIDNMAVDYIEEIQQ